MSAEENKALFRRFVDEVMNRGDVSAIDELFAPAFVEHEALPPGVPRDRAGVKQFFALVHRGFSDVRASIDDEIAEGDKVVARLTVRGRHTGEYFGVPPTGKSVSFEVIDICRIAGGQVVEHWGISDVLGLMQQLGAIPAPGQPGR